MRVAVYGLGAIGGLIGARLAGAGCEVSAVVRGNKLAALRTYGLRLQIQHQVTAVAVRAEEDPAQLGNQDIVIVAVKAPALPNVAAHIAPLIGPDTIVITAMNGVPWWFFEGDKLPYSGTRLQSLDPSGALSRAIPVRHVIGCVVHLSSSSPEPGLVRLGFGNRLILGEPDGASSERLAALVSLLDRAGFEAEASPDIRTDIWYKLWGNMTMNPISAITGATADKVLDDPLVRNFCLAAMQEAAAVGAKVGCPIAQSGEDRMAVTRKLGAFKTSMLQDAEAGKALEIDALVTVVHEIGELVGVATPSIDSLLGLVRLYGQTHGIYPV
jgi:2-dehydropantoate 2-reductase